MSDLNKVIIEGRLVKAADLSHWNDGTPYCNFTIGNNETYKKENGEYESIGSFFDCVMKGNYAETMAKHLLKGRGVRVVGRLKQQKWEKDGQKYSRVVVKVEEIHLSPLQNNSGAENNAGYSNQSQHYEQPAEQIEDEVIPFSEDGEIPF